MMTTYYIKFQSLYCQTWQTGTLQHRVSVVRCDVMYFVLVSVSRQYYYPMYVGLRTFSHVVPTVRTQCQIALISPHATSLCVGRGYYLHFNSNSSYLYLLMRLTGQEYTNIRVGNILLSISIPTYIYICNCDLEKCILSNKKWVKKPKISDLAGVTFLVLHQVQFIMEKQLNTLTNLHYLKDINNTQIHIPIV